MLLGRSHMSSQKYAWNHPQTSQAADRDRADSWLSVDSSYQVLRSRSLNGSSAKPWVSRLNWWKFGWVAMPISCLSWSICWRTKHDNQQPLDDFEGSSCYLSRWAIFVKNCFPNEERLLSFLGCLAKVPTQPGWKIPKLNGCLQSLHLGK